MFPDIDTCWSRAWTSKKEHEGEASRGKNSQESTPIFSDFRPSLVKIFKPLPQYMYIYMLCPSTSSYIIKHIEVYVKYKYRISIHFKIIYFISEAKSTILKAMPMNILQYLKNTSWFNPFWYTKLIIWFILSKIYWNNDPNVFHS